MKNTLIRQEDLDITSPAKIQPALPVVIRMDSGRRTLILPSGVEVEICKWSNVTGSGYSKLHSGGAEQIPITDFISELEAIIAEVKRAHGLDAKVLEWDLTPVFEQVSKVAQL